MAGETARRTEKSTAGRRGVSIREEEAKETPERRGIEIRKARTIFFNLASPRMFMPIY